MHQNRRTVRVEWGHCDPAKIVFYPQYFRWFDEGTYHLFESVGLNLHKLFGTNGIRGTPLVGATAKFMAPSRHGDDIEIESEIAEWGRASFKVAHRVFNRGVLAVEGLETRVWAVDDPADPERIRPSPIPAEIIARFK